MLVLQTPEDRSSRVEALRQRLVDSFKPAASEGTYPAAGTAEWATSPYTGFAEVQAEIDLSGIFNFHAPHVTGRLMGHVCVHAGSFSMARPSDLQGDSTLKLDVSAGFATLEFYHPEVGTYATLRGVAEGFGSGKAEGKGEWKRIVRED